MSIRLKTIQTIYFDRNRVIIIWQVVFDSVDNVSTIIREDYAV